MSDAPDKFTLYDGDLQITHEVKDQNPYGYSYSEVDGKTVYFDDDGEPVNPEHRPITDDDIAAATRAFKMEGRPAEYLQGLVARFLAADNFAGAVVAKAARRALEKSLPD